MADSDVTGILQAWAKGDTTARDRLVPAVYAELRRCAAAKLRREPRKPTLEPTDLVHEAYLKLVNQRSAVWRNRAQFFAVAAEIMRRILVDRARANLAAKRSGQWSRITLNPSVVSDGKSGVDVLDLDAALTRLHAISARKSQVAELRFFAGLSLKETASALDISPATAERDWQFARAWLYKELQDPSDDDA